MEDGLAEAIDEGKIGPRDDPKVRSKTMSEEYGWDKELTKKIWCFGPDTTGEQRPSCHRCTFAVCLMFSATCCCVGNRVGQAIAVSRQHLCSHLQASLLVPLFLQAPTSWLM